MGWFTQRNLDDTIGVLHPMKAQARTISCSVLLTASCFTVVAFSWMSRLRNSWCVAPKEELLQLIQPCGELLTALGGR